MGKLSFLRGMVKSIVICNFLSQYLIGSSEDVKHTKAYFTNRYNSFGTFFAEILID